MEKNTQSTLNTFVGRQSELEDLRRLLDKKMASLVVIKGRRRIGKSRLIEEFSKSAASVYTMTGLPPTKKTTAQSQREVFAKQLGDQFQLPGLTATDWSDLFSLIAKQTRSGRHIIVFDEISWMGSKDANFLGKLKNAWDMQFKQNPQLILILCGSISTWIEDNLIKNTGFLGRFSLKLSLNELSYQESMKLLAEVGFRGSTLEKLMLLGITGGVPRYIELIGPSLSATENIRKLCFEPTGILVEEFKDIFHDLFGRRGSAYQNIAQFLANGPAEYSEIADQAEYPSSGVLSEYLSDLVLSGYLSKDFSWSLKTGHESRVVRYRLRDNYIRFYLRFIEPNLSKIKKGQFKNIAPSSLPGWDSLMGLQFENVVLNNRSLIHSELSIRPEEIINDNPFFQRKNAKQRGCQVDYLIQAHHKRLYVCEVKFSKYPVKMQVLEQMQQKIDRLARPKGFSCVPVLICANGVTKDVRESHYFSKIINFSEVEK